jgi:D-psicose/D-tagatose/L-ribulose 3-epimerase
MPTFGVHAFVWNGDWNNDIAPETIRQSAEAGFDLLEIPLLRPAELDTTKIKKLLQDYDIRPATSLALPEDKHLPFFPDEALHFLKLAVDTSEAIGSDTLAGCLYCHLGTLTGQPPTETERETCVNVLGEVAHYAKQRGIQLGIEPVNRYESYLYNVGSDVVDLIEAIGTGNMFVHFDTYHVNIEEHGFSQPIAQADQLCGYVHMSESDRGMLGEGNVDWDDVFKGLKIIEYTGPLVIEAFAAINPDLIAATCLWRPGSYSADDLATRGLEFLHRKAEAVSLA